MAEGALLDCRYHFDLLRVRSASEVFWERGRARRGRVSDKWTCLRLLEEWTVQ